MKSQDENETEWKVNDSKYLRRNLKMNILIEIAIGTFFFSAIIIWALINGKSFAILLGLFILSFFLLRATLFYLVRTNYNPIKVGIDSKGIHLVCNGEKSNRFRAWDEIAKVSHSKFNHIYSIQYNPTNRRQRADFVSEEIGIAILNRKN